MSNPSDSDAADRDPADRGPTSSAETNPQVLLPGGWPRPQGYANGVASRGRQVFIAGMIGWDAQGIFHSDDFGEQARQALQNLADVLAEAGGKPEHIVRMT